MDSLRLDGPASCQDQCVCFVFRSCMAVICTQRVLVCSKAESPYKGGVFKISITFPVEYVSSFFEYSVIRN